MTLTFNPMRAMIMTPPPTDKLKFNGQWVQKTEWKQTDGKTDGQTDGRYQLLWLPG